MARSLGQLLYMKIWHDNSGKDNSASWFLKYIIIRDLQTQEKFYFLCQNWLAVEKGDGKLYKELFVSSYSHRNQIKYILPRESKHNFNDYHLWFSIFSPQIRSSYSRLERVTCCFALLYLTSLLDVLYFEKSIDQDKHNGIDFGYFYISFENVNQLFFKRGVKNF